MPEGRVQFLTHHTEPLVWRDGFLDHPNGARALTGLWIAAEEPAEPTARFGRFTGRPASQAGEVTKIVLDRGAIHIARGAICATHSASPRPARCPVSSRRRSPSPILRSWNAVFGRRIFPVGPCG
jgi:hypothetical protein